MNFVLLKVICFLHCWWFAHAQCSSKQEVNGIGIEWELSITDENVYYYSTPYLCIDEHGFYVLRRCEKNEFVDEEPTCTKLQDTQHACFDGLELTTSDWTLDYLYCYSLSTTDYCQYKDVQVLEPESAALYHPLDTVWMPYHQKTSSSGIFTHYVPNGFLSCPEESLLNYRTSDFIQHLDQIDQYRCYGFSERNLNEDCNLQRPYACFYKSIPLHKEEEQKRSESETQFCQKTIHKDCRMSWEKTGVVCVCPKPLSECQNPAVYPVATGNCALGLKVFEDGVLRWISSGKPVENTFWSSKALQPEPGNYVVWSDNGWTWANEVDCIMCEVPLELKEPTLQLKFNNETLITELVIENEERIFSGFDKYSKDNNYKIKCFTESTERRYDFDLKYSEVQSIPGLWQCAVTDLADTTKKIYSNILELDYNFGIYYLQIIDDLYVTNIKEMSPLLEKYLGAGLCYLKVQFQIESDNGEPYVQVVYRLWVNVLDDEYYFKRYKLCKDELTNPDFKYAHLKPQIYNLRYCSSLRTYQDGHSLFWPGADVGEESQSSCYDQSGERMRIKCVRSFTIGARFTPIPYCYSFKGNNISDHISDLENAEGPPNEILTNLTNILEENFTFSTEDFNKTANILEKLREDANVTDIISVISTLMTKDPNVLYNSQQDVNVTDRVLYTLDFALKSMQVNNTEEVITHHNLDCVLFDVTATEYSGIAYFNNGSFSLLVKDMAIDEVVGIDDLESAVYINMTSFSDVIGVSSITMFNSSVLFNEKQKKSTFPRVFGVLLPDDLEYIEVDIEVMLVFRRGYQGDCAYWSYGQDSYGKWKADINPIFNDQFIICLYNHTTHYGQLIMLNNPLNHFSDLALSTMTTIECVMSLIGLCGVLITGMIFPTWRTENERILHYCVVLLVQTVLLFVNSDVLMEAHVCIVFGVVLHFTVLVQFCWMMAIALHQRRKLVQVFQNRSTFWESRWIMLFIYGGPLLIVIIAVSTNSHNYTYDLKNKLGVGICYPEGYLLVYSLLIPAVCLGVFNGYIFINVLAHLFCFNKRPSSVSDVGKNWLIKNLDKVKRLVLLVFTMGVTWWFGFGAMLLNNSLLLCLFSITTSIQGFVIFVFIIICNKKVRDMYRRKYALFVVSFKKPVKK